MFKILFFSILFSLFAQAQFYTIKLAMYKNLPNLQKEIAKLKHAQRKQVKLSRSGKFHRAFVKPTANRARLQKDLSAYRKVFSDAFITTTKLSKSVRTKNKKKTLAKKKIPIKKKKVSEKRKKVSEKKKKVIVTKRKKVSVKKEVKKEVKPAVKVSKTTPIKSKTLQAPIKEITLPKIIPVKPIAKKISFYEKLQDKIFFICSHGEESQGEKVIMTVYFTQTHVYYSSVLGKVAPLQAEYKIKDKKLFIYQKDHYDPKIHSTFEKSSPHYHLISSWLKGKKMNSIRYFFNFSNAQTYMRSLK